MQPLWSNGTAQSEANNNKVKKKKNVTVFHLKRNLGRRKEKHPAEEIQRMFDDK